MSQPQVIALEVNIELANAIANYLGQKPFVEVANLIQGLQQSKPVHATPEPPVEKE